MNQDRAQARWRNSGSPTSGISALRQMFPSFSSSGAAYSRAGTVGRWKVKHGTRCRCKKQPSVSTERRLWLSENVDNERTEQRQILRESHQTIRSVYAGTAWGNTKRPVHHLFQVTTCTSSKSTACSTANPPRTVTISIWTSRTKRTFSSASCCPSRAGSHGGYTITTSVTAGGTRSYSRGSRPSTRRQNRRYASKENGPAHQRIAVGLRATPIISTPSPILNTSGMAKC